MAEIESDPGMVDPGKEIDRARAGLAAAQGMRDEAIRAVGGYVVDPERAQACIREMDRILTEVRKSLISTHMATFDPPGFDEVSLNVTRNAALMASRAAAYIEAWAGQIEATRTALQRQLDAYLMAEQANASERS
ncbi:PE domain-containing protein [Pseudonocardia sp. GCM10023141]|uniref:PE domain-containing protein n=1 Tax=Pseudonocardia sp. GCM10023141 TaxID=3252653 RepID=UPI0036215871